MSISDDQRREVAARLREVETMEYDGDEWCDEGDVLDALGLYNDGDPSSCDPEKVAFLADLIDHPTCNNVSDFGSHTVTQGDYFKGKIFDFVCSHCGFRLIGDEMYNSPLVDYRFSHYGIKYCPNCGAEVVE